MAHNNKLSYKQSIVVFLDILGFKRKVASKNNTNIKQVFNILTYTQAWDTKDGKNLFIESKDFCAETYVDWTKISFDEIQQQLQITYFSDSLVITLPYEKSNLNTRLFLIIRSLAYLMSKLSASNYFVRGSIVTGKMFHKSNMFFGPAFLEAYKLESENAIYPRVILSQDLTNITGNMPYIKKAEDGLFYVDWTDFIRKTVSQKQFKTPNDIEAITHIQDLINQNIEYNKNNLTILAKYEWLKNHI